MAATLEFDSIELAYGDRSILSGIYMKCDVGEVIGILGRNGSGKSSLLRVVFGNLRSLHKSIRINGESLQGDYMKNRLIAYLPQGHLIPPSVSVGSALKLFGIPEQEIVPHFPEIKDFLSFKPGQLSVGYLRIIETLLILKSNAKFCLLDEPFSGLMPLHIEKMKDLIGIEKKNKGIIITDHVYREVLSISDRLYILSNGKTYVVKAAEELITHGYVNMLC